MSKQLESENEQVENRVFFVKSAGYVVYPQPPKAFVQDGVRVIDEGKPIRFGMVSQGWGSYRTSDPAEIEFLESRDGVYTEEQYLDLVKTERDRLEDAKREIRTKNALIEKLEGQLKKAQSAAAK